MLDSISVTHDFLRLTFLEAQEAYLQTSCESVQERFILVGFSRLVDEESIDWESMEPRFLREILFHVPRQVFIELVLEETRFFIGDLLISPPIEENKLQEASPF
jgi:hypothetical protein